MNSAVTKAVKANNIAAIYNEFKRSKHHSHADKTLDLIDKLDKNEFVICFSGHFSAGKSTMINHLLGEDILPQSPIPTSANVVKLSSGKGYARVYFKEEGIIEYREPYDLDTIKSFCKDGDAIYRIEISKDTNVIPSNVSILDTPGIDSSNDADRIMTESSLHTVDVIFYVMDYNHVQSEVNLLFLKEMQERGKPIYIIVNQIDKHRDLELSFHDFTTSVKQALSNWGIHPKNIYFTSLVNKKVPINQFDHVRKEIHYLMEHSSESIGHTLQQSLQFLIEEHTEWIQENKQEEREQLKNQLLDLELNQLDSKQLLEKYEQKERLKHRNKNAEKEFRESVSSTLKNAYLMPFELREKAEAFLQSQQPSFKVGLISTKKKVETERNHRLHAFYEAFMKTVEANIVWKLREKIIAFAKKYNVSDSELINVIQTNKITYKKQRLVNLIKSGASITGDYLLVYTEDVSNDIKQAYRQQSSMLWTKIQGFIKKDTEDELTKLSDQLVNFTKKNAFEQKLMQIDKQVEEENTELKTLLFGSINEPKYIELAREELAKRGELIQHSLGKLTSKSGTSQVNTLERKNAKPDDSEYSIDKVIDDMEYTDRLLDKLPGFQTIQADLEQKKQRLQNRHYTVALFGAFSAGKSSFANALLGENILPVSPNPTTAAINKISPSDEQHEHGTVIVQLKSEQSVLTDINQIAERDKELTGLADNINRLRDVVIKNKQLDPNQRSFLKAIVGGYEKLANKLGNQLTISIEQFSDYVSNEELACYVEWMELFYDCPLTEQGITLVDTPGADSINARHTDVSFDYIKQADAILFVTYYNHAFSKADKEFLLQLGRVKDAFSLDKMFFIVNAADLAKDKQEIELVTSYVSDQLQQFNIHDPRMFAISSLKAIEGKKKNIKTDTSGINNFEHDFYHFINQDLMEILIRSSYYDIERSKQLLNKYVDSASMSNEDKQALLNKYLEDKDRIAATIEAVDYHSFSNEITQKTDKQVYYVSHRTSIQFNDRFKETFNPSTIKSSGRAVKTELETSLKQLLSDVGYELAQEMRAVSLRLELFINTKAKELNQQLEDRCKQVEEKLALTRVDDYTFQTPIFKTAFEELDLSIFNKATAQFKNTKSFFENNEKEKMKDAIFDLLEPFIRSYLEKNKKTMLDHYLSECNQLVDDRKQKTLTTVENYYTGLEHSLSDQVNVEELQKIVQKMNTIEV